MRSLTAVALTDELAACGRPGGGEPLAARRRARASGSASRGATARHGDRVRRPVRRGRPRSRSLGPRWVWWTARETAPTLVAAGVRPRACWDLGAVGASAARSRPRRRRRGLGRGARPRAARRVRGRAHPARPRRRGRRRRRGTRRRPAQPRVAARRLGERPRTTRAAGPSWRCDCSGARRTASARCPTAARAPAPRRCPTSSRCRESMAALLVRRARARRPADRPCRARGAAHRHGRAAARAARPRRPRRGARATSRRVGAVPRRAGRPAQPGLRARPARARSGSTCPTPGRGGSSRTPSPPPASRRCCLAQGRAHRDDVRLVVGRARHRRRRPAARRVGRERGRRPHDGVGRAAQPPGRAAPRRAPRGRARARARRPRADRAARAGRRRGRPRHSPRQRARTTCTPPSRQALGSDRPTAKVAVLAAMYGQTTGPAGAALKDMDRAYPTAMAFLRAAEESRSTRRRPAHLRRPPAAPLVAAARARGGRVPSRRWRTPTAASRATPSCRARPPSCSRRGPRPCAPGCSASTRGSCSACTTSCSSRRPRSTPPRSCEVVEAALRSAGCVVVRGQRRTPGRGHLGRAQLGRREVASRPRRDCFGDVWQHDALGGTEKGSPCPRPRRSRSG